MKRKKNIDGEELGHLVSPHINMAAANLVNLLTDEGKNAKDSAQIYELLSMCNALYYLFIDRLAFGKLKPEERTKFCDTILNDIFSSIAGQFESVEEAWPVVENEVYQAIDTLAPYAQKPFPYKDEGTQGTLYWEFSKLIADKYNEGSSKVVLSTYMSAPIVGNNLWKEVGILFPAS